MKISYFSVYDKKANSFGQMFPSATLGTAERSFKDSVVNPESPHSRYPDDYALYHVMDFDDESGYVTESYEPPRLVVQATQLVPGTSLPPNP